MVVKAWKVCTGFLADYAFEYSTPKIVTVRSIKIGLMCRFVELSIVAYVIGYALIYEKGYQETDVGQTSVTTKVKGVSSTMDRLDLPEDYRRIWDVADYVIPPMQYNAFFILTNVILTPRQRQRWCPEVKFTNLLMVKFLCGLQRFAPALQDPSVEGAKCNVTNNKCKAGEPSKSTSGIMNGACMPSERPGNNSDTCEIRAWCSVENDNFPKHREPMLKEAEHFTVYIKNSIEFNKFSVKRSNTDMMPYPEYIRNCTYNPKNDTDCPIFRVSKILELAGTSFKKIGTKGGVINILIKWDCDLDYAVKWCTPTFQFSKLDDGWNFRHAYYYRDPLDNHTLNRDLTKASGILFLFNVQAKAGKFSIIPLAYSIGAGLALLGIAQVLCDWFILYVVKERHIYKQVKFLNVDKSQPITEGKLQGAIPSDPAAEGLLMPRANTTNSILAEKSH